MNVKFPGMRALRVIIGSKDSKVNSPAQKKTENPASSAFAAHDNSFQQIASRTVGKPSSASAFAPLSSKELESIDKDLGALGLGIAAAKQLGLPPQQEKDAAVRIAMLHTMLDSKKA